MSHLNTIDKFAFRIDETWTIFLDRDGVINRRIVDDYVKKISEFELLPGALEAIKYFSDIFGRVIVVTNQQGVAKGKMTVEDVENVHAYLREKVEAIGGKIDAFYFCPDWAHQPNNCRKPNPTMALKAQSVFPDIDFSKSIMIGDMPSDIAFGHGLGMRTMWIKEHPKAKYTGDIVPDLMGNSLSEVRKALIKGR